MNAIVLTFDRLPINFLACYGNNWIETPNFDRLAAHSATFHQHFAESLWLDTVRHAWWSGRYECRRWPQPQPGSLLPNLLAARGVNVRLLLEASTANADERSTEELSQLFPDCTEVITGNDGLEVAPDDTPFLRLVTRAQRALRLFRTSRSEPWLLWIKSRGVPIPWLPPAEYARKFLDIADDDPSDEETGEPDEEFDDEGDSKPQEFAEDDSPLLEMSASQFDDLLRSASWLPAERTDRDKRTDFDRALTRKVVGGYVALLDYGLGRLLDAIEQNSTNAPTLLLVTAAQGLTVHDASNLRGVAEKAADERVHLPLMVRPAGLNHGVRRQSLTQPVDIFPTLAEWFGAESLEGIHGRSLLPDIRGEETTPRQLAFAASESKLTTVRSPDYYLVRSGGQRAEVGDWLFAKPEDTWEVNNLATQRPEVFDQLSEEMARFFVNQPGADAGS
jgi:arylsulfatase A-like enzyme